MKKQLLLTLAMLMTSCGGGSSHDSFKSGFYSGDASSKTKIGLCKFVAPFGSYSVRISEIASSQNSSDLLVEKVGFSVHGGIYNAGISVTVPAGSGDVSFSDFDANPEFPTDHYIGDDGNGSSLHLSCLTKTATVYLNAEETSIHFEASSKLDCIDKTDETKEENFTCDIDEEGELISYSN